MFPVEGADVGLVRGRDVGMNNPRHKAGPEGSQDTEFIEARFYVSSMEKLVQ